MNSDGITPGCIYYRMKYKCQTLEQAMSYPSNRVRAKIIKESGIPPSTVKARMRRKGMSLEEAIAFRSQRVHGETLRELAERHGLAASTLTYRLYTKGMSIEEALSTPVNLSMSRKRPKRGGSCEMVKRDEGSCSQQV